MKDYADEILKIVLSCVSLERAERNGQRHIPQLVEWTEVIQRLNSFIKNETFALESEIVALTEQLLESDSLISARKRKSTVSLPGSSQKRKKTKMINGLD
jgi:hypothetical protein